MSSSVAEYEALDNICLPEHGFHAFDSLYCSLTGAQPVPPAFEDEKYALFVTWNTLSRRGEPRLRGCIGNFGPMPIRDGIAEYALISALEDHRFRPIQRNELEKLQCCVSLLTTFENAANYLDWTIGVHGISITFTHPFYNAVSNNSSHTPLSSTPTGFGSSGATRKKYSACYLPDVIPAQGWTKLEAIDSAIHKSGWSGAINDDLRRSIQLKRYQSFKGTVTWNQYVEWRKAQGGKVDS
ncbi:hypothetical protein FRC19_002365 [Serendipita sp. 401]|nr:hypothetical protein FRC15_000915 [Serendipita sp. 397]KAG8824165.1 hypothetical protein FRC19_002365 [Serendipita sp. 401]KAG9055126.1 hypothetical protein FS842_003097 [Serendipita sp. 407]